MKQLVILSGKGGTGKTSVTAAFAHLASTGRLAGRTVLADADVDAANLELVLSPDVLETQGFYGGQIAIINPDLCSGCGTCEDVCRFNAVHRNGDHFTIDPIACDGCAACVYLCPTDAIRMETQFAGQWFRSETSYGPLLHAALRPGQENSGRLVTMVKQQAKLLALDHDKEFMLVDGPPGIGCPVISSISGADLALIVSEPTAAGAHDMQRVLDTAAHFGVPVLVCINKADLYPQGATEIEEFCLTNGLRLVGKIPFDPHVVEAMVQGKIVTAMAADAPASRAIREIWDQVLAVLLEDA